MDLSSERGYPERVISVQVTKIAIQPSKYKPVSLKPVEMEVLGLKRAIVSIRVEESSRRAEIRAILEFKGKGLILSRTIGNCDVDEVARYLGRFYHERYERFGIRPLSTRESSATVCDCTVDNPENVLGFFHLIKNNGGLTVTIETSGDSPLRFRRHEYFRLGKWASPA